MEAAHCGGVTEVPDNGAMLYKIRFYHGLMPYVVQGPFYEPGSNAYQKPDCPCSGMIYWERKQWKKSDAVF